jgi:hypothetical protein
VRPGDAGAQGKYRIQGGGLRFESLKSQGGRAPAARFGRRFLPSRDEIHTKYTHNAKCCSFESRNTLILLQAAENKEGSGGGEG